MSSVSYAHAAAGSTTAPASEAAVEIVSEEVIAPTDEAEVAGITDVATNEVETEEEKDVNKLKNLSPAPLPAKSAWAVPSAPVSPVSSSDAKWPTPEAALIVEQQQNGGIKPASGKWVPLKANLVIASPKNNAKTANTQQKKTKTTKTKTKTVAPKKKAQDESKDAEAEIPTEEEDKSRAAQKPFKKYPFNSRQQNGTFVPYANRQSGFAGNNRSYINGLNSNGYKSFPFQNNYNFVPFSPHQNATYHNNTYYSNPQYQNAVGQSGDTVALLTYQIDYYFSVNNLAKDIFLRKNFTLENEGKVPVGVVLAFARLQKISQGDIDQVKKCLLANAFTNVEVFGLPEEAEGTEGGVELDLDAVYLRAKENWEQWILPVEN
ncbi:hypothetical protein BABINDRAFT_162819 [Babjeviella inositovora NRRL Y-12698]|uniref:HTH La-type RNA-binding domain-containing protein n=1 Tax=Babjeviella inositovora NRRL Y-12698 TaxID=984486 RepID=A0A1E3QMD3_9ASCO|nr:uncharacterized protein BABINDRAFT_162819 [Babjeviella inositovora NRRL Y-12698]ODQ78147.1 hypothetical protein BABINDRAFT_162819 [Babjeviella inositovora NRRL Y-12698]